MWGREARFFEGGGGRGGTLPTTPMSTVTDFLGYVCGCEEVRSQLWEKRVRVFLGVVVESTVIVIRGRDRCGSFHGVEGPSSFQGGV